MNPTNNQHVLNWLNEMAAMTKPDSIVRIDGSEEQVAALRKEALASGEIIQLNQKSCRAATCTVPPGTTWRAWRGVPSSAPRPRRMPETSITGWILPSAVLS